MQSADMDVSARMLGETQRKRRQDIILNIWFYSSYFVFLVPLATVGSLLCWKIFPKKKLRWFHYLMVSLWGVYWLTMSAFLALRASDYVSSILTWYSVNILFSLTGEVIMSNWSYWRSHIRGLSANELFEKEQGRSENKKLRATQSARERSMKGKPPTQPDYMNLGAIEFGDSLPSHAPLYNHNGWLLLKEKVLNQHMFVLGATGAGKTEFLKSLINEVLTTSNRDIFIVDGKGDYPFAQDIANLIYHRRGTETPIFRFGHGEPESVYDGFQGSKEAIQNRLYALLQVDEADGNALYYANKNKNLIQLICGRGEDSIEPPRSMQEVRDRVSKSWLESAYKDNPYELRTILDMDDKSLEGLRDILLHIVRDFSQYVDPHGFSLDEVSGAIFSIDTLSVGVSAKHFLDFLVEDFKNWISARKDPMRPGLLVIDEFGAFGNSNIIALLSLARSMNLGVVLATQDVASLTDDKVRDRILGNSIVKIIMRSDHSDEVASLAGTQKNLHLTLQNQDGDPTGLGSLRFEDIFKVHPNEVARLREGECFVVFNRYATKVHSKMVVGVPDYDSSVAQFGKPEWRVVGQEENAQEAHSAKQERADTRDAEAMYFDEHVPTNEEPVITVVKGEYRYRKYLDGRVTREFVGPDADQYEDEPREI